jgi:hypothetical protein
MLLPFPSLIIKIPSAMKYGAEVFLTASKVCNKYTIPSNAALSLLIYYVNIYIADASFPPDNKDGAIDYQLL